MPNNTKSITNRVKRLLDDLQKYDIIIYPNDHVPAHVHFEQAERVAVIELVPEVRLRQSHGFNQSQIGELLDLATYFREFLLDKWDELHTKRL